MSSIIERVAFDLNHSAKKAHIPNPEFECILMFKTIADRERYKAELMGQLRNPLIADDQLRDLWDKNAITIAGITFHLRHQERRLGQYDSPETIIHVARGVAESPSADPVTVRLALQDMLKLAVAGREIPFVTRSV